MGAAGAASSRTAFHPVRALDKGLMAMSGTLRVVRHDHLLDRHRKWDVVLDGKVVGSVANGQCCELAVRARKHTISVGHPWLASPVRTFSVKYAEEVEFACRPRPHPMMWIPYGVASLVRHDLFIVLEPTVDAGLAEAHAGTSPAGNGGMAAD